MICSDADEHRRRAEVRSSDVDGLVKPTWTAILEREYEPWHRRPLIVDSATTFSRQRCTGNRVKNGGG